MAKVRPLRKRGLRRQVDGQVVELLPATATRPAGVRLRAFRKRRGVFVPLDKLAYFGLQLEGYKLTPSQWQRPLQTLQALARQPRTSEASD